MLTLNPSMQIKVAENVERAIMGVAPSLTIIKSCYGQELLETWIMAHLENLNTFCGVKQKMTPEDMEELARMIIVEFHFLRATELMLFFHRYKAGRYGEFFGVVDPQKIMIGLTKFETERMQTISKYEQVKREEELNKQRDEWKRTGVTRQQYEQMKKNNNDTTT